MTQAEFERFLKSDVGFSIGRAIAVFMHHFGMTKEHAIAAVRAGIEESIASIESPLYEKRSQVLAAHMSAYE